MSTIRRQSIISSLLIYVGFIFGALNTFLFAKKGAFTPEEYGLTRAIISAGTLLVGFANLAIPTIIYKFSPYYKSNLKNKENDLLGLSLVFALVGFTLTTIAGILFEPLIVQKFSNKSPQLVHYYFWIFPYLFFQLFFTILEAHSWSCKKTVVSNFLREGVYRISTTLLIFLFLWGIVGYDMFIKLFSCLHVICVIILVYYLASIKQFHLSFKMSRVTKKFWKKIFALFSFVYAGMLINTIAATIDSLTISSYIGMAALAVFDLSTYISNIISVPQKSVVSISIPFLSEAWKNKDFPAIQRIYTRSSINLLLISIFILSLIWLNYDNIMNLLPLNPIFKEGKTVVLILGIKFIIDMGTGVNAQIIGTSTYWRFEFICGVILLSLITPLNLILVKKIGINGAAYSTLISFTIYNIIRLYFLWAKFKLQPFSLKTIYALLIAAVSYIIAHFLFGHMHSWLAIFLTTMVYTVLFAFGTIYFKISPDIAPVFQTIKNRWNKWTRRI